MKMTNKTYDKVKFYVTIVMPALITLIVTIGQALNYNTDIIVIILGAITAFVGKVINDSSKNYNKED